MLERKGLDKQDIQIIKNLYWHQQAYVKFGNLVTDPVDIQRGVRQGCVLSPLLFNMYSESIFAEALQEETDGIKINGQIINNLRYADDTVIIADTPEGLQRLLTKLIINYRD